MEGDQLGWFAHVSGERSGPFPQSKLEEMILHGDVGPGTLVWHHSLDDWKPVSEVPELSATLERVVPPPVPSLPRLTEDAKQELFPSSLQSSDLPLRSSSVAQPPQATDPGRRTSTGIGTATVSGLWVMAVVSLISAIASYDELSFIDRVLAGGSFSQVEADAIDNRVALLALVWLVGFVVVAILFISWLRKAYGEARRLDADSIRYGKAWTVWSWVVPIAFLYIPFRIVRDVWTALRTVGAPSASEFIMQWWLLFLATNALAYVGFSLVSSDDPSLLRTGSLMGLASDAAGVIAALLAVRLVRTIDPFVARARTTEPVEA